MHETMDVHYPMDKNLPILKPSPKELYFFKLVPPQEFVQGFTPYQLEMGVMRALKVTDI